tara:strand:- start:14948 stop:15385 length:438 start_codon:yes stop_codon:yes gene_type:complete
MAKYDDFQNYHRLQAVTLPTSVSTPVTSAAIDTTAMEQLTIIANVGAMAASGVLTLTMTESATLGGSYTAQAGASIVWTQGVETDQEVKIGKIKCNHIDQLPFKKVVLTPSVAALDGCAVMIASSGSVHYPLSDALTPVFNLSNP